MSSGRCSKKGSMKTDHSVMLGTAVACSELWLDHLTMVWRFVLVADWLAFFHVQVRICFVESIF